METAIQDFLQPYSPITMALLATIFTWLATAAGAPLVFFSKTFNQKIMDGMLGICGRGHDLCCG